MATLQTFLQRHGSRYHFRCRVLSDLVERLGRREIVRALGTSCPKEARQRVLSMAAETFAAFEGLRMGGDRKKDGLPVEEFLVSDDMFFQQAKLNAVAKPPETVSLPYEKVLAEGVLRHSMMFRLQELEESTTRLKGERDLALRLSQGTPTEPPPPPKPKGEPWKSRLDVYKDYARLSDKTWKSYDQVFRRLEKAAGNKPIDAVYPLD